MKRLADSLSQNTPFNNLDALDIYDTIPFSSFDKFNEIRDLKPSYEHATNPDELAPSVERLEIIHETAPDERGAELTAPYASSFKHHADDISFIDEFSSAKPSAPGGGKKSGGDGSTDPVDTSGIIKSYISSASGSDYNIKINFQGSWTAELQKAFISASNYISSIILGDVPDIKGRYGTDDITISAELTAIDGSGGILGQAGPTAYRTDSYLPATGIMQFDNADAADFNAIGLWDDIVFHEMLHTLGMGSMWGLMGLTSGSIAAGNLMFTGALATDFYNLQFGDSTADGIPLEMDGGAGTAGSHWDEALFANEIMTGYINTTNYLSEISIAALEDMGYDTVLDNPYDPNDLSAPIPNDFFDYNAIA